MVYYLLLRRSCSMYHDLISFSFFFFLSCTTVFAFSLLFPQPSGGGGDFFLGWCLFFCHLAFLLCSARGEKMVLFFYSLVLFCLVTWGRGGEGRKGGREMEVLEGNEGWWGEDT